MRTIHRWGAVLLVAAAAACGSSDPALPDGPPPDPDAPDGPAVVTVHVRNYAGEPVAGIAVFGHDAAGAPAGTGTTDGNGSAALPVPSGGSVTARAFSPNAPADLTQASWHTVLAVEPGDDINLRVDDGDVPAAEVRLTAPALPGGATNLVVAAPCAVGYTRNGDPPNVATVTTNPNCPDHGPAVLSARAGRDEIAYLSVADVSLAGPAVTVSGTWAAPAAQFTATVTGIAPQTALEVERSALVDGWVVHRTTQQLAESGTEGTAQGPHPGVGDGVIYDVRESAGGFCASGHRARTVLGEGTADAFTLDLAELLPPITALDLGPSTVSWTGGGGGSGVAVWIEAMQGSGDVGGNRRAWYVTAPPGASITLPADVGFAWPSPGSGDRISTLLVNEIHSTYWASYADLRQRANEPVWQVAGDFVTRRTSLTVQLAYLGCPMEL